MIFGALTMGVRGCRSMCEESDECCRDPARRARGPRQRRGPRPTDPDLDAFLWSTLGLSGRMAARKIKPYGLELDAGDSRRRVPRAVEPRVVMRGAPGEIALYLSGRKTAAVVQLDGPEDAVRALAEAIFGL
jgi:hypothetical protein